MKVKITVQKTMYITREFDVTDEQLDDLEHGINPFYEEMEKDIEQSNDVEYDYMVSDLNDEELIPWD